MCKIFLTFSKKKQRKLRQTKFLLFNFLIIKFTVIPKKKLALENLAKFVF